MMHIAKIMNNLFPGRMIKIIIIILAAVILIYSGMNIIGKIYGDKINADGKWLSDQTNIIQYLYWPSYCVQIAEKNKIAIDAGYKSELKNFTLKTLAKAKFSKVNAAFLLGQLLWLNEYYQFDYKEDILIELKKYFDINTKLFSWNKVSENTKADINEQIDTSYELYNLIKLNPANLSEFDLIKGFSKFLAQPDHSIQSWGKIFEVTSVLIESGNQDLFDKNKIYDLLIEKTDDNLMKLNEEFMTGNYIINLDMVSCAKDFSDFKIFFENDKRYMNLNQSIYNELTNDQSIGYDKNNPLFALALSMIHDVRDLKQNLFVSSNYNKWLVENFHYSTEYVLKKALGN